MRSSVNVFIGLGSNLSDPLSQLKGAIEQLKKNPIITFIAQSSFYRTPPMGPQDQPDYCNAVVAIETTLAPLALLDQLQQIENNHGRRRDTNRWGARTLDLDILLYGSQQLTVPRLNIPHIGLHQRAFVLYPLAELVDDLFEIPGRGLLSQYLAKIDNREIQLWSTKDNQQGTTIHE